ncbi:MAG: hypothetical protein K1X81_07795 [Bacteroidia bacterium]|nr:hypothetical protein [Bacteroidia bacterium]
MSHIKLLLLITSLSCLSLHCKKESEEDKLPPATASGKQTFGCKINGKNWIGETGNSTAEYWQGRIKITGLQGSNLSPKASIMIGIVDYAITKPGYYEFKYDDPAIRCTATLEEIQENYELDYCPGGKAALNITRFDTIQGYISGQFNFVACNKEKTSYIIVTEGRFDFKYK